jgi:hypothetical protein
MSTFEKADPLRPSGGWFENTPWWLISMGLHAVVLLGAALIYVERLMASEDGPPIVIHREPPAPFVPPVDQRDVFTHNGGVELDPKAAEESVGPSLFDPLAKKARHNESDDDLPFMTRRGESKEFLSYLPGGAPGLEGTLPGAKNPGTHRTMGVGGTNGYVGRFGDPKGGGHENLVATGGGDPRTESTVTAALRWLARHQGPEGGWSAEGFPSLCVGERCRGGGDPEYDTGLTGLAVLAFLGAGYSHVSRDELEDPAFPGRKLPFGQVVKKGLQWLIHHQDPEGCVGPRGMKYMYNHAIAALALSEAYGMTSSAPLKSPAQAAIDFLLASQNPGRGWRYSQKAGDNDTSVTGWAVMALKSAEMSELHVPKSAFAGATRWLDEATEKNGYYRTGYTQAGTGKVFEPGTNEQFSDHPAMSAVAVMSRIFMTKNPSEPALVAANALVADLPQWRPNDVDFYYWYYGSLALFQKDGPQGPLWRRWNEPMKNAIVPHQSTVQDGCRNGSWNPEADRWGRAGGRVYAVALNALTLEVYYRYANVFGGGQRK